MVRKLILWFGLASAACLVNSSLADIRTTPHSLVRDNKSGKKTEASEICVFCHTPNVAGTPPHHAPLWQRSIGTDLVFTIYDDIGRLGLGKASVGSQSIACLSCHDANQARAASKNSSDHPFGVPYRGASSPGAGKAPQKPAGESTAPSIRAKHAITFEDFRNVSQGIVEDRTVWWVSRSGSSGRRTRNDLPLYERHDEESGRNLPYIECSSCHDPHSSNTKFLRLSNESSQLCLTCHIK